MQKAIPFFIFLKISQQKQRKPKKREDSGDIEQNKLTQSC